VTLPIHATLPSWAASLDTERAHFLHNLPDVALLWITVQTGAPRSVKGLSQFMSRTATEAGLPTGCTAHGLRKARATSLAEAGATPHQIGAWLGHASLSEIVHYTRDADLLAILSGPEQEQNKENRVAQLPKSQQNQLKRKGNFMKWWTEEDSNPRPPDS